MPKSSRGGSWHPVTQALPFSHGLQSEGLVHQKPGARSQVSRWHHQVTAGALHVRQKSLSNDKGEEISWNRREVPGTGWDVSVLPRFH